MISDQIYCTSVIFSHIFSTVSKHSFNKLNANSVHMSISYMQVVSAEISPQKHRSRWSAHVESGLSLPWHIHLFVLPFWFKQINNNNNEKNNLHFASRTDILHIRMQEEQQLISSQGVTCIFNNSFSICEMSSAVLWSKTKLSFAEPSVFNESIWTSADTCHACGTKFIYTLRWCSFKICLL